MLTSDQIEAIARETYPNVLAYCRRRTYTQAEAEDATQEVYLRLVKAAPGVHNIGRNSALVMTIARNVCIDLARKRVLTDPLPDSLPQNSDSSEISLAIDSLPEELADVIELIYSYGLSMSETAAVLSISRFSAARRRRQALNMLAELLSVNDAAPHSKEAHR
ncbi:RNA polymerase sigma factor [Schaalia vaccimaxillae]|uniref:RNA polymerase sigma factor n=1 Tax=Schaalia vaccimaxillae TaxID=183916 RepID=UPI0003B39E48|nr:sigma-70 family RNA polymerase sigma factor [Schaalia vaccimaxillae]